MPKRAHGYVGGVWDEHAKDDPNDDTIPYVLLVAFLDVLLEHNRPRDIRVLWVYVSSAFEADSPLRSLIWNAVSKEVKEEFMTIKDEWIAEGVAKSLLRLLESRAIAISEAMRERVLATRDESLLLRWFDRAVSMTTAEEVFASLEASG